MTESSLFGKGGHGKDEDMKLSRLCRDTDCICLQGSMETEISDIVYDSRKIRPQTLFVCMSGAVTDGHQYIPDAVAGGAAAILVERKEAAADIPEQITVLHTPSARRALACLSAAYFDFPDRKLVTIGVTGTKGKTTTTYMMKQMLEHGGHKTGLIGTIEALIGDKSYPAKNTTPESYEIHRLFAEMVQAGCTHVVMEVSSQGLKLDRTAGICFDYGIFTNLSEDHIGPAEHADFAEYLACKRMLFAQCKVGIVNADDAHSIEMMEGHSCTVQSFSAEKEDGSCTETFLGKPVDLQATDIAYWKEAGRLGMCFQTKGCMECAAKVSIPGRFSVYNALASMLVCHLEGISDGDILDALQNVQVRGRVEILPLPADYHVVIDYAHNEVSTRSVLEALLAYEPKRLICLYGGGGNRSKLRRYAMGEVTGEMADLCVLTCDNPRNEEIRDINRDIQVGLAKSGGKFVEIDDRQEAIAYCLREALPGDMIVLLGKGHETYQEIKGVKYPYDEREAVLNAYSSVCPENAVK